MEHQIRTVAQLRELVGEPVHPILYEKASARLTDPIKSYIRLSPFLALATHAADGSTDVSPRGDAPGFAQIIDDRTLMIPDRPGNKRHDSVINIIENGRVAMLFMIPGVLETVRVNGNAVVTTDPQLLTQAQVNGKIPRLAIVVHVQEAYGHCSKAFRRSKLWEKDYVPDADVPTLAEMMAAHLEVKREERKLLEQAIAQDAEENLY
jgi:uncharacterized protein